MAEIDVQFHVCSKTEVIDIFEREEAEMRQSLEAIAAAASGRGLIPAIHSYENLVNNICENMVRRTETKFTPEVLHDVAYKLLQSSLERTRAMRDAEYKRNDELRAKGVSYSDRAEQVNFRKIEWCNEEETRISTTLQHPFKVRPLREWFTEDDYWLAKRSGMGMVMRLKMGMIIISSSQRYGEDNSDRAGRY